MRDYMIELENVAHNYHSQSGETKALENITLHVPRASFTAIVGPSGCGKSTILSLIAGLLKPCAGSVRIDNRPVAGADRNVGYMLQQDHLFAWRTIRQNAQLGLETRKCLTEEGRRRVDEMLSSYGLKRFENSFPAQLSGGMRQRVALIRTLALDPQILLLDEPFSALDYQTRLALADEVKAAIRKDKKTAVLVTHDISEAISMADTVYVLSRRPAIVKAAFDTSVLGEDTTPFDRRRKPGFQTLFNDIWKELDVHVT